ncbi:MAG: HTTM domain-containing protein, partial [Anaerolineae bacterium]|nr:HTTM domain-containing protein [Anaerolineae bacterium]
SPDTRKEIYETVAPVVRLELILLYFFVTLANLNYDFFDPAISCGALMFRDLLPPAIDPGLPVVSWMATASLWVTILAEGGLPILLLFKRTRPYAIPIGLLFHFALGFHPHLGVYSFSALMYMMYFVFTGDGFITTLNTLLSQIVSTVRSPENANRVKAAIGVIIGLVALMGLAVLADRVTTFEIPELVEENLGVAVWFTWSLVIMALYMITLWRTPADQRAENTPIFVNRGLLWIMPIIIAVNGLFPYFGYKTEISFAMFSNLRTEEDNTNHLFLPTSLQFADYQRGLVDITSTDNEEFQYYIDNHMLITRFEFERMLTELDDFTVTCDCYGTTLEITREDGVLSGFDQEMSYDPMLGRFFRFRAVSKSEQMPCTH